MILKIDIMILRVAVIFFLSIFYHKVDAQVVDSSEQFVVYETYQDYKADKGVVYDEYRAWYQVLGKYTLRVTKGYEHIDVKCKNIWGFTYKGALFISFKKKIPLILISKDKICYYENGPAHLQIMKGEGASGTIQTGSFCYFSQNIESEIFPYVRREHDYVSQKFSGDKELFECIKAENRGKSLDWQRDYQRVRKCVLNYNAIK